MGYNKKIGVIMMVLSVFAAISLFLIADCDPCSMEHTIFQRITTTEFLGSEYGYRLKFLDDSVNIPYKYVLLSCLSVFTVGLLFFLEAINAPYHRELGKLLGCSANKN